MLDKDEVARLVLIREIALLQAVITWMADEAAIEVRRNQYAPSGWYFSYASDEYGAPVMAEHAEMAEYLERLLREESDDAPQS